MTKISECQHRGYAFEMQTSHYFQYVANNIEGLGVLFEEFFESVQKRNKGMQLRFNDRLMELGTNPTDDPGAWEKESGVGRRNPRNIFLLGVPWREL